MPQQYKLDRVAEISETLSEAKGVYMTDFSGLSVEDITNLRREFRKANVNFVVVKNTLAKISAEKVGLKDMIPYLTGPTGLAVSNDDPVAPIRVIVDFQKKHQKPSLKAAILEGKVLNEREAAALKDIPPRDILLGQVVSGIASPLTGLVGGLQAILRNLVYTLNAVKEKKE
jgi:large subunit ribosomal protein L10